ncbi:MAG TPA: hypothetical protein VLM37_00955, partial [Fibrobacteraceae bacterium]|nr:hypothetical protein [Fibrobacteraceae bacterium]
NTGDKASDRQVDDFYLKEEVQKIHALTTQDKRFFFSYNTEEDQELHMIQISIEWRVGEQTSNTQKFQITKTGYFNANGELVCFWVRTPKI